MMAIVMPGQNTDASARAVIEVTPDEQSGELKGFPDVEQVE